jgi:hypothetical protein
MSMRMPVASIAASTGSSGSSTCSSSRGSLGPSACSWPRSTGVSRRVRCTSMPQYWAAASIGTTAKVAPFGTSSA